LFEEHRVAWRRSGDAADRATVADQHRRDARGRRRDVRAPRRTRPPGVARLERHVEHPMVSGDVLQSALHPGGLQAARISDLWWLMFWVTTAVFVVVCGFIGAGAV